MQLHTNQDILSNQEVAHALASLSGAENDRFTKNWKLHSCLQAERGNKSKCMAMISDNKNEIENGYDFLLRISSRIAAAHGAWPLVRRFKSAMLCNRSAD